MSTDSAKTLKILLSFAVGGLLGDVFLHLLPEAWENHAAANTAKGRSVNHASMGCGLWVLAGFLVFVVAEKMFSGVGNPDDEDDNAEEKERENEPVATMVPKKTKKLENNNCDGQLAVCLKLGKNGFANGDVTKINGLKNGLRKVNGIDYKKCNGYANGFAKSNGAKNGFCADAPDQQLSERPKPKHVIGYLNLVANCVDNFTHGLAVGGSFLVSFRLGALTTFAILIHEIPHEIGDFAILLKSGFNRWDAAKAQLMTATGGMCGAFVAVVFSGDAVESRTSWILPFTAGGFLHIGLVTVLPELLKETDPWESLKQIGALLSGISVMAFLTIMCD
ncbi:zinc transporter ZIP13 isoform X2 [Nasonia vitripennis]|uniref:Zinc transporter ZIP13 homolog n=1 Tax=Nasonia vitripennis TaxID=7425 RepID=A0A7M7QF11_NASVI|nr:zinc transporter ZIP13 isoform X2 [Nasonia vitripennis]